MKGKGDLNRKKTHKMRSTMGMAMQKEGGSGGETLGGLLRQIITGKES